MRYKKPQKNDPAAPSNSPQNTGPIPVGLRHTKLERRRLLNAHFELVGADFLIDSFEDSDLDNTNNNIGVSQDATYFIFTLDDGEWVGGDIGTDVIGSGTNTLMVDQSFADLVNIILQSDTADQFDIQFDNFDFGGEFSITGDGGNSFGTVSQDVGTAITNSSLFDVSGALNIELNNSGNDFSMVSIANADDVLLQDSNSIVLVGLTTNDGDAKLTVGDDLAINGQIDLGDGNLILDVTGNVTQTDEILANGLGLMVDGTTTLQNMSNHVSTLAIDSNGETLYTDDGDVEIGSVTVDGMTVTGITTSNDNVKLDVDGSLQVNAAINVGDGDVILRVRGDLTQTDSITAHGLGLMVGELTTLQDANNNVEVLSFSNDGETLYTDFDNVVVGEVTVDGMTITGGITSDDDAKLTIGGDLAIDNAIDVGVGDLFLAVAGNVTQTEQILAHGLGLMVGGTTTLQNMSNHVAILAADNDGETLYTDDGDVEIGSVTVDGMTVTGITTSNDNVKLDVDGSLQVNAAINVGDGDVILRVRGDLTQTDSITAHGLGLMVGELTTLQDANNNVEVLSFSNDGLTLYTDIDDVVVGEVTVDGMTITGGMTSDDDAKLTIGGDLAIDDAIDVGVGDLFLAVAGNVTQTEQILAHGLGLMVGGTTTLQNMSNHVAILAADNDGETLYTDDGDVEIGSVTVDGMTVTGITTSDDNVKLDIDGSLQVNASINVGDGDVILRVRDDLTQTASITAHGLGLMVGELTILQEPSNNVEVLSFSNDGLTLYTDIDDVVVGEVTVDGMTITGGMTSDDDAKLTIGGDLAIDDAISLGMGNLFLAVDGNVTQTASIQSDGLGLMVTGTTTLQNPANDVNEIAADNGGETLFTNSGPLTVGSVMVDGMLVTGITTTDDNVKLTAGGELAINEAVSLGDGNLFLDVAGDVTQAAPGTIMAAGLALMVDGTTTLQLGGNNVDMIAADNIGGTFYTDADSLIVGSVSVDGMLIVGLTTSELVLEVGGNLTQTTAVIVAGTTSLTAIEEIWLTGGDNTEDGLNDNDFMGEVTATATSVEIVDANDLLVGDIDAVDDIFLRSGDNGVGALTLNGNLTTTAADGQVLLQSDSGVTQAAMSVITTSELLLGGDLADEGSGDFVLDGDNVVDQLAADLEDSLEFVNSTSLVVSDLTYSSVCGTFEAICGLNIGGDLSLNITGGLMQTAAVIVQGETTLMATEEICLTGGDCIGGEEGGDGLNDNDFVGEVTASGTTVEIVDSNALIVGDIDAVDDIFLRSGDNGVGALTLNGNLTTTAADGQILLQSDSGVTQAAMSVITTSELLLGGDLADEGSGDFVLDGDNVVGKLAADLEDSLEFVNSTSLVISDLAYDSVCGTMEAICGLNIGGDLSLDITGGLTQTAAVIVQGETTLTATEEICLTGGDCTGDGLNDNDFVGEVTASGTTVEIVDANALTVGDINAVNDIFLRSGDNGVGALTLNGNLTTTAADGQILLQSDSGVTQAAMSVITTSELLLGGDLADEGSGDFVLDGDNVVDQLAADLEDSLEFVNSTSLVISDLAYDSVCGTMQAICGLNIGGDLSLDITGGLTQTAAVIVQGETSLTATEEICLTGGDCTGDGLNDNDFVGEVTASGTTVEIVDANDLLVGDIDAVDDIFLRSGDNGVGALTLNGNLTTTAADGQVLLQSDSGVTQAAMSVITTSELLLGGDLADEGSGDFVLDGDNVVDQLAADLEDSLEFVNSTSLVISDLTYDSVCGTMQAICGLNVGGDLSLDITGGLTQTAAVIVQGETTLTATEEICLTGGDCTGDGLNDNDFVGEVTASGTTVEIVDANALIVGDIDAVDDIFLAAGDNGSGALTLNGNLTTSDALGQVLLRSDGGVDQLATSVIETNQLLLQSTTDSASISGDFNLIGANVVDRLAGAIGLDGQSFTVAQTPADLLGEVSLTFNNVIDLQISNLQYVSVCSTDVTIAGLSVDGNVNLTIDASLNPMIDGDLTQTAFAPVRVTGSTNINATGNVVLLGDGDDPLADGNNNDFVGIVNVNTDPGLAQLDSNFVEIADVNNLIVEDANANDGIHLFAGASTAGLLNLIGEVTAANVLLQSSGGADQDATNGVVTTDQLVVGGDQIAEGSGAFILQGQNQVDQLAGNLQNGSLQFQNLNALTISSGLSFTGSDGLVTDMATGIFAGGNGAALAFTDPNITLADTAQGINNDGQYNPAFGQYLDASDVGIAILNQNLMTIETGALVNAVTSDIYLETVGDNDLMIEDTVRVDNVNNRILVVAGGELQLEPNGRLERGGEGLITTLFNDITLQDPTGSPADQNALIDLGTLTQTLQFIFGDAQESNFDASIFWGIMGTDDNSFTFESLTPTQLMELDDLFFGASPFSGFESRSFYSTINLGNTSETLVSQPIGGLFDNSGTVSDASFVPSASFTLDFLRNNPEFRSVVVLFNDANINLFQNASSEAIEDLNIATADFEGLARFAEPARIAITRPEIDIETQIDVTPQPEVQIFETSFRSEDPLFVQTVQEKFYIVVYFDSQFEADLFEGKFGDDERDFREVLELLKELGLEEDFLEWSTTGGDADNLDANRIREILTRADLDLEEDDEWVERFKNWLRSDADTNEDVPDVPRGVYKILEVDNGKAIIQGDDIDRKFVPEPEQNGDGMSEPGADEPIDSGKQTWLSPETDRFSLFESVEFQRNDGDAVDSRLTRWSGMLRGEEIVGWHQQQDLTGWQVTDALAGELHASEFQAAEVPVIEIHTDPDQTDAGNQPFKSSAASLFGLLAALTQNKRQDAKKRTTSRESKGTSLMDEKAASLDRNIFSSSARFRRRSNRNV